MNTSELETLIRTILSEQLTTPAQTPAQPQGKGIFQSVSEAIDAAHQAFLRYQQCPLKTRSAIISAIRQELTPLLASLAEESANETGMGNKEDKFLKNKAKIVSSERRALRFPDSGKISAIKQDASCGRLIERCQNIQKRCLSGP